MNKKFLDILYTWPKPYISGTDLTVLLNNSPDSRYSIVKRAVQENYLISLKKDLYLIRNQIEKAPPDTFELAPLLYGPSYISLESALSFHGWIPEAVTSTTSVSAKRSKNFTTPLGTFFYKQIPLSILSSGINQVKKQEVTLFIADPWKALADYIYTKKREWLNIQELNQDLRIEFESLKNSDISLLHSLIATYPSLRVKKTLNNLLLKGLTP